MTIFNIIDNRKRPYRYQKVNAIIEPIWHDNSVEGADQTTHRTGHEWIGYDEREHITMFGAIRWASSHPDEVTLYIYDEDSGIYPQHAGRRGNDNT